MPVNTFDVIERRKRVTVFKLGKLWVFKQFFDNHELFNALLDYYNKDLFRFEFKSTGARNNALKLLERKRLRLRPGGGPEGLHGPAPQISEICPDPEELRGLQGDSDREAIPDEGPGGSRGSGGLGRENLRRSGLLLRLYIAAFCSYRGHWPVSNFVNLVTFVSNFHGYVTKSI